MTLSKDDRAQGYMPVVVSVRNPATLPVLILFGAVRRLCL
jgi:hypothetical protein